MITGKLKPNRVSRKNRSKTVYEKKHNKSSSSKGKFKSNHRSTSLSYFENKFIKTIIVKDFIPITKKLELLILKEPNNDFYKNLQVIGKKSSHSSEQLNLIIDDFQVKILGSGERKY